MREFDRRAAADAPVEECLRFADEYSGWNLYRSVHEHVPEAVVRLVCRKLVADVRSQRIRSLFVYIRTARIAPTPNFILECFRAAICAADMQLAAALLSFALVNCLCTWPTCVELQADRFLMVLQESAFPGGSPTSVDGAREPNRRVQ